MSWYSASCELATCCKIGQTIPWVLIEIAQRVSEGVIGVKAHTRSARRSIRNTTRLSCRVASKPNRMRVVLVAFITIWR